MQILRQNRNKHSTPRLGNHSDKQSLLKNIDNQVAIVRRSMYRLYSIRFSGIALKLVWLDCSVIGKVMYGV